MTDAPTENLPPDWSTLAKDLHCPLCEYNLRGLTESRCPECGFAFTWAELLDALKNKHPYLFEYGRGRNINTFCKTWWRTSWPRRFWREVNPAQDVKIVRLIVYWVISSSLILLLAALPYAMLAWSTIYSAYQFRANWVPDPSNPGVLINRNYWGAKPIPVTQLDVVAPPLSSIRFWNLVYLRMTYPYRYRGSQFEATTLGVIFLAWPWLTLMSLLIFRISMRQAKIKTSHVLRAAIYSCDSALIILFFSAIIYGFQTFNTRGELYLSIAGVCAVITSYRLTITFQRYLRVHLPFATVLASQLITLLVAFVLLIQIADFFRRI